MFHIFQALNPRAPEETFANDTVTPRIAQDHAQQRASARTFEEQDFYEGKSRQELAARNRILKASAHLAADRVALRRTLAFVQERWQAGAGCEETFSEAEQFRVEQYEKLSGDKRVMLELEDGVKGMDPKTARERLVDEAPIRKKKAKPQAAAAASPAPKPRR